MEQEMKEWMNMFMMESGKEIKIKIGFVLTLKRKGNLKKQTMTSLPYYLTKAYQTP